jgi:hypothetical protein
MRSGSFEDIDMLVNGKVTTKNGTEIPEKRFNASVMREGPYDESGNLWNANGSLIHVRIPWSRLNVSDPSSLKVLNDNRAIGAPVADQLQTAVTDGFIFDARVLDSASGAVIGRLNANTVSPYIWMGWEVTPPYRERLKKSYTIVRDVWRQEAEKDILIRQDFIAAESAK